MRGAKRVLSETEVARESLHSFLTERFHRPDLEAVDLLLAASRSHFFRDTKPVWIWLVGVAGSGKTDIGIRSLEGLPFSQPIGEINTKAFITAKKGQRGILQRLPVMPSPNGVEARHGILTFKDFTSYLSMRPEDRAVLTAQMREIADGYWSRHTGESAAIHWHGKVTLIAACTPELEYAWALHRRMGDRFITLRWQDSDDAACAMKAQDQQGHEEEIAATIKSLSARIFGRPEWSVAPRVGDALSHVIILQSRLSCWLRTPVHRDTFTHKIDDAGPREKPMRLVKAIQSVIQGHAALSGRDEVTVADLALARRLALDSAPWRRRQIVLNLRDSVELNVSELSETTDIPRSSVLRELEELEEIGIVHLERIEVNGDKRTIASLTPLFISLLEEALSPQV
jgi:DNA-binding transcriptional ArsR family regulator